MSFFFLSTFELRIECRLFYIQEFLSFKLKWFVEISAKLLYCDSIPAKLTPKPSGLESLVDEQIVNTMCTIS